MDGCPEDGDIIPIRLFLHGIPKLTPTYHNIHHRLSVKYGLNLVLIDQKGKKYFKQADIILYRNYWSINQVIKYKKHILIISYSKLQNPAKDMNHNLEYYKFFSSSHNSIQHFSHGHLSLFQASFFFPDLLSCNF